MATASKFYFRTDEQNDIGAPARDPHETWAAPQTLTQSMIDKAKVDLEAFDAFMRPAPMGPIEREGTRGHWLMQLSMLCAGQKGSMQEYMEKTAAYAAGLHYPQFCFTAKTLYAAARKFKFIPTFSELADFFDPMVRKQRVIRERLAALAKAQPYSGMIEHKAEVIRRWSDLTPDEQRKHEEMMKGMRAFLISAGVGNCDAAAKVRRQIDATNDRTRALLEPIMEEKRKALVGIEDPKD